LSIDHNSVVKGQLESLFAMPIYRCQIESAAELNEDLLKVIYQQRASNEGIVRSNLEGWHSPLTLHTWDNKSVQCLMLLIKQQASQFIYEVSGSTIEADLNGWEIEAWANVNPSGASNKKHTHDTKGGIILSSFYYVNIGKPISPEWAGNTWFEDRDTFPAHYRFEPNIFPRTVDNIPKPGEMVLFPSWLPHGVREYRGDDERVTIAVNLWHKDILFTKTSDTSTSAWAWKKFPKLMSWFKKQKS